MSSANRGGSVGHSGGPSGGGRRLFGIIALLALAALVAGIFGIARLLRSGAPEVADGEADRPGALSLVRGTGTSWAEETPSVASGAIEGLVLDGDGKPVDGAQVTLGRAFGRDEEGVALSYMHPKGS